MRTWYMPDAAYSSACRLASGSRAINLREVRQHEMVSRDIIASSSWTADAQHGTECVHVSRRCKLWVHLVSTQELRMGMLTPEHSNSCSKR